MCHVIHVILDVILWIGIFVLGGRVLGVCVHIDLSWVLGRRGNEQSTHLFGDMI